MPGPLRSRGSLPRGPASVQRVPVGGHGGRLAPVEGQEPRDGRTGTAGGVVGRADVIVPLKRLSRAKTRLTPVSAALPGSDDDHRGAHRALVIALARDTLAAVLAAARVRRVVVVTAEPDLVTEAALGPPERLEAVDDPGRGLNAALRAGSEHLRAAGPGPAVAALQADLPALRAAELDDALGVALARTGEASPAASAAFVADRHGTGTTLLVTAAGRPPVPRFGPGSAAAHRAAGAVALDGTWPGLRADVDTPADLDAVRAAGCGPATRAWPPSALAVG